jgi:hypothetical protein
MSRYYGCAKGSLWAGIFLLLVLILFSGCTSNIQPRPATPTPVSLNNGDLSWIDTSLEDLQGKGNFSIGSFAGKSVIVLVVSDACPTCVIQLSREIGEIERLAGVQDRSIMFVALDIDPPGNPGFIEKYHDQFSFSGYTARSSEAMTLKLLRDLGPFAIDTEVIPVILVCPGGDRILLPPGFKPTDTLNTLHTKEC